MRRILVTSALLVAACASDASSGGAAPAPQPPPDGGCTLSVAFGLKRTGEAFTPFPASGGGAPITLGFQGFRYVESTIRLEGTTDETASLAYEVSLAGRAPASQDGGVARLTPGEGGARYADTAQIFFNDDPLPQVIGKTATIVVRARAGACEARTEATLLLLAPGSCGGGASCADAGLLSSRCPSRSAPPAPGSERAKRRSPTSRFRRTPTRSVPASACTRRSRTATTPTPSRSRPTRARFTSRSRATRTSPAARSRCSTRARGRRSAACAWARARRPCACTREDASSPSRRASPTGSPSSTRRPTPS